ncbi:sugar phosphate isomerase/epimerase family protein [Streptomyces sp. NPDC127108]|uniref:sugar phosphate isomerase/epimerase family protein n=1 Tax=Streptomyces sp. NPDC127108 TaxID=3345361 RepID=UPI00362A381B
MIDRLCGIGDEGAAGLARQIAVHLELQLQALELRTMDGRGVHLLSDGEADAAAEAVSAAGLTVPVVDTPLGSWSVNVGVSDESELEILRRAARNAKRFSCRQLRIMSYPNDGRPEREWRAEAIRKLRLLVETAAELDVVLLHENCHGWASTGAARTLELVSEVAGLRLLFDIGNGIAHHYRSLPFLREVLPYVEHVHIKDGTVTDGQAVFGRPGEGDAELLGCLQLLVDSGYQGWYSVEPHVALIPHLGVSGDPERTEMAYVDYVRRLKALVGKAVTA